MPNSRSISVSDYTRDTGRAVKRASGQSLQCLLLLTQIARAHII